MKVLNTRDTFPKLPELTYKEFKHPAGGTIKNPQFLPEHLRAVVVLHPHVGELPNPAKRSDVLNAVQVMTAYDFSQIFCPPGIRWAWADELIAAIITPNAFVESGCNCDKFQQLPERLCQLRQISAQLVACVESLSKVLSK